MEVSVVSLASGIPSRACWLGELGALVSQGGVAMFPKQRRVELRKVPD